MPPASFTVAVTVAVSPTDVNVFDVGDSSTVAAAWPTVTDTVAVMDSEGMVAVIVTEPSATAATKPEEVTVATASSDEDQVIVSTVAPVITVPATSFTVGTNVTVSPTDVNVFDVGDSSIVAATWATVTDTVAVAEPTLPVSIADPFPTA